MTPNDPLRLTCEAQTNQLSLTKRTEMRGDTRTGLNFYTKKYRICGTPESLGGLVEGGGGCNKYLQVKRKPGGLPPDFFENYT